MSYKEGLSSACAQVLERPEYMTDQDATALSALPVKKKKKKLGRDAPVALSLLGHNAPLVVRLLGRDAPLR